MLCLPLSVVEKPNGLLKGVEHAPRMKHLATWPVQFGYFLEAESNGHVGSCHVSPYSWQVYLCCQDYRSVACAYAMSMCKDSRSAAVAISSLDNSRTASYAKGCSSFARVTIALQQRC